MNTQQALAVVILRPVACYLFCCGVVVFRSISCCTVFAAPGDLLFTLRNPEPGVGGFGTSAAGVGGDIVVGAPGQSEEGLRAVGSVYLFDGDTGTFRYRVSNPELDAFAEFGFSVAGAGSRIFVGAPGDDFADVLGQRGTGSVYVFNSADGSLLNSIPNPDPNRSSGAAYGQAIANVNGNILASAPSQSYDGKFAAGVAYLVDAATGETLLQIASPSSDQQDIFGTGLGVAAVGSNILVGSFLDDVGAENDNTGRAFLFDGSTGQFLQEFVNPQSEGFFADWFGFSVAGTGDKAIVGARNEAPEGFFNSGAAYVFDSTTGELMLSLASPRLQTNGRFGRTVAGVQGNVLVEAEGETAGDLNFVGAVYLFDGDTGRLLLDIPHPEPSGFDLFGHYVARFGKNILVSAPGDGAVYVFRGVPEPDTFTGVVISAMMLFFFAVVRGKGRQPTIHRDSVSHS